MCAAALVLFFAGQPVTPFVEGIARMFGLPLERTVWTVVPAANPGAKNFVRGVLAELAYDVSFRAFAHVLKVSQEDVYVFKALAGIAKSRGESARRVHKHLCENSPRPEHNRRR